MRNPFQSATLCTWARKNILNDFYKVRKMCISLTLSGWLKLLALFLSAQTEVIACTNILEFQNYLAYNRLKDKQNHIKLPNF